MHVYHTALFQLFHQLHIHLPVRNRMAIPFGMYGLQLIYNVNNKTLKHLIHHTPKKYITNKSANNIEAQTRAGLPQLPTRRRN